MRYRILSLRECIFYHRIDIPLALDSRQEHLAFSVRETNPTYENIPFHAKHKASHLLNRYRQGMGCLGAYTLRPPGLDNPWTPIRCAR